MKIYNLPRGAGKTLRILYISEYSNAPILCATRERKEMIKGQAKRLGIDIPEPITLCELAFPGEERNKSSNYLVDEALTFLQELVSKLSNGKYITPLAISFTEKE